jgi:hypothetical protein
MVAVGRTAAESIFTTRFHVGRTHFGCQSDIAPRGFGGCRGDDSEHVPLSGVTWESRKSTRIRTLCQWWDMPEASW